MIPSFTSGSLPGVVVSTLSGQANTVSIQVSVNSFILVHGLATDHHIIRSLTLMSPVIDGLHCHAEIISNFFCAPEFFPFTEVSRGYIVHGLNPFAFRVLPIFTGVLPLSVKFDRR